jgi:hypothetical protein
MRWLCRLSSAPPLWERSSFVSSVPSHDMPAMTDQNALTREGVGFEGGQHQRNMFGAFLGHRSIDQASGILFVHVFDARLGGQKRAIKMDRKQFFPIRKGKVFDWMNDLDPGIWYENVDTTKGFNGLFEEISRKPSATSPSSIPPTTSPATRVPRKNVPIGRSLRRRSYAELSRRCGWASVARVGWEKGRRLMRLARS